MPGRGPIGGSRTAGGGGVVLDSRALAVELVVDDPRGLGLGGGEAALDGLADRGLAGLLRGTLREAGNVAGEHGGWWCWAGGERCRTLKSKPL